MVHSGDELAVPSLDNIRNTSGPGEGPGDGDHGVFEVVRAEFVDLSQELALHVHHVQIVKVILLGI